MDSNPICHPSPAKIMKCSLLDYIQLLMIGWAGQWTRTPSTTLLQPKKWNAHFWLTLNFWWLAGLVDGLEPHLPPLSSQKNEMPIFGLRSTSDDWLGRSMASNPVCHPSPAKKMKCLFLDYIQLLMISRASQWTRTPSATPLQPKKCNAHFWIIFNFWWLAGQVNGLKPHLLPLSSQKNEMLIFGLHSTSDAQPGWSMDLNPICHPSPAKTMKCLLLDYILLLMIGWAGQWTQTPSATLLQSKNWNVHFWITFNFWWLAGLVDGLKHHLPPLSSQKKWNACFWITFHFWWLARLVNGLESHLPPLSSQKKCNAHFWIMFNFWWSARLVDGLEPHLPPLSSQKNEILFFVLYSASDDRPGWSMDMNPSATPLQPKKMKCSFLDYIQLLMIGWAGQWPQTPSATPPQPKKMQCSVLDYIQLLMIGRAGRWTQTPSTTPLQPKKWNAHFCIIFNFWWSTGLVNGHEPFCHPSPAKKNEMLIFRLHSTSDDWPGWSMASNPICHPSPAKKMQCSVLDYIQLLMIGWIGRWTQTPSTTPLQPKKWNAHFGIMFNFCWLAGLIDGLKPCLPPLSSQKNEMLLFGLHSTSDDWLGWSMDSNPIHHFSAARKMKCSCLDYV